MKDYNLLNNVSSIILSYFTLYNLNTFTFIRTNAYANQSQKFL